MQHCAQILQTLDIDIKYHNFGAQPLGHLRGAHAGMSATKNADAGPADAGDRNDGNTAAAVLTLQILAAQQRRGTARNFTHGASHCPRTVRVARRFYGDASYTRLRQRLDLLGFGSTLGHVESGHDDLAFFEGHLHVALRHVLELDDEIAFLVDLFHGVNTHGASIEEFLIGDTGRLHDAFLEINSMPLRDQSSIAGNQASADTGFAVLQFVGNTNNHAHLLLYCKII